MKDKLVDIFGAALAAADPGQAVRRHVTVAGTALRAGRASYDLDAFDHVLVVGAGKGAARMAGAAAGILGSRVTDGVIIVKYGHGEPLGGGADIKQVEAAHPLPDASGVEGTRMITGLLEGAGDRSLVVCLLSGGGSALLVSPARGVSLDEMKETTRMVMDAGADIAELNAVRKHISRVKGGRLARLAHPATLLTLIVSDVIGDRLDVIASGPTVPDATTFADAIGVIERYGLGGRVPRSVVDFLERGARGEEEETPKGAEPFFRKTENLVVASLAGALEAARERAAALGFEARVVTAELDGDVESAASGLARSAAEAKGGRGPGGPPLCLISGGETTVEVRGGGMGGRNQHLALAFALEVEGMEGVTLLSAGTDGTDGPTDAAGAVVDGGTARLARAHGLDPSKFLEESDSYTFFERLDAEAGGSLHLKTGPTGTNVMDVQIIAVEG
ncbi:MAG: glycerate kinase [Thermodesulfobacteriota bacterium]